MDIMAEMETMEQKWMLRNKEKAKKTKAVSQDSRIRYPCVCAARVPDNRLNEWVRDFLIQLCALTRLINFQ